MALETGHFIWVPEEQRKYLLCNLPKMRSRINSFLGFYCPLHNDLRCDLFSKMLQWMVSWWKQVFNAKILEPAHCIFGGKNMLPWERTQRPFFCLPQMIMQKSVVFRECFTSRLLSHLGVSFILFHLKSLKALHMHDYFPVESPEHSLPYCINKRKSCLNFWEAF